MRANPMFFVIFAVACGVPNGKPLDELDAGDREKICDGVSKETAVCDGLEFSRSASDCERTLASVSSNCSVTVGEFEDAIDGPICAYVETTLSWDDCFGTTNPNGDANNENNENNIVIVNSDANNGSNNGTTGENNGEFDPQFLAVVDIITMNCALGGCHGNPPGAAQVHMHPSGQNSTPAEVEQSLSVSTPAPSGNRLVQPGEPSQSEIYIRITKPEGDLQLMGAASYGAAATPLSAQDIDTIERWIADGANYRTN